MPDKLTVHCNSNQVVERANVSASTRIAAARYTLREAASLTRDAKVSKTSVSYAWYSLRLAATANTRGLTQVCTDVHTASQNWRQLKTHSITETMIAELSVLLSS